MHLRTFRLEEFESNFTQTIKQLLDMHGILDQDDRQNLIHILQTEDVKNKMKHKRSPHKEKHPHITHGTYDKEEQIDALLKNIDICSSLKNKTILLDYQWKHSKYC